MPRSHWMVLKCRFVHLIVHEQIRQMIIGLDTTKCTKRHFKTIQLCNTLMCDKLKINIVTGKLRVWNLGTYNIAAILSPYQSISCERIIFLYAAL